MTKYAEIVNFFIIQQIRCFLITLRLLVALSVADPVGPWYKKLHICTCLETWLKRVILCQRQIKKKNNKKFDKIKIHCNPIISAN